MVTLKFGTAGYVELENRHPACPADLDPLTLFFDGGDDGTGSFGLPSRTLGPGERVIVYESTTAGQISSGNQRVSADDSEYIALCNGACGTFTSTNMLDLFVVGSPFIPGTVTFSPGGFAPFASTRLARRVAFVGARPTFQRSDWQLDPAPPTCNTTSCAFSCAFQGTNACCVSPTQCGCRSLISGNCQ
jgi:hypothetical protein